MAEADAVAILTKGQAARAVRLAAARGMLPLPRPQLLVVLVHLCGDGDAEVSAAARQSLGAQDEKGLVQDLKSRDCDGTILEFFSRPGAAVPLQEAVAFNPAAPSEVIAGLAQHASPSVLEAILYNRVRILESPEILKGIRSNPQITADISRLVREIELEFLAGRTKQEYSVSPEEPAPQDEPVATQAEAAPEELAVEEVSFDDLILEGLPLDPEAREQALSERLSHMTVNQKIRFAVLGPREARTVLIRDPNKEVARSVLKSPKLTASEVESIAGMRSVSEDILREIGNSREWIRSYGTVCALLRNPKTPVGVSQRHLFRLTNRDLSGLTRDRGVPDLLRRIAHQTLAQRQSSQKR